MALIVITDFAPSPVGQWIAIFGSEYSMHALISSDKLVVSCEKVQRFLVGFFNSAKGLGEDNLRSDID